MSSNGIITIGVLRDLDLFQTQTFSCYVFVIKKCAHSAKGPADFPRRGIALVYYIHGGRVVGTCGQICCKFQQRRQQSYRSDSVLKQGAIVQFVKSFYI